MNGLPILAPYGLYAWFEEVGSLRPYASSVEELVELQFSRYHAWLGAMERAGVERQLFFESGGGLLQASTWNPVRLNPLGTVELRGLDYPRLMASVGCGPAFTSPSKIVCTCGQKRKVSRELILYSGLYSSVKHVLYHSREAAEACEGFDYIGNCGLRAL